MAVHQRRFTINHIQAESSRLKEKQGLMHSSPFQLSALSFELKRYAMVEYYSKML
jgi:hypothetical protein